MKRIVIDLTHDDVTPPRKRIKQEEKSLPEQVLELCEDIQVAIFTCVLLRGDGRPWVLVSKAFSRLMLKTVDCCFSAGLAESRQRILDWKMRTSTTMAYLIAPLWNVPSSYMKRCKEAQHVDLLQKMLIEIRSTTACSGTREVKMRQVVNLALLWMGNEMKMPAFFWPQASVRELDLLGHYWWSDVSLDEGRKAHLALLGTGPACPLSRLFARNDIPPNTTLLQYMYPTTRLMMTQHCPSLRNFAALMPVAGGEPLRPRTLEQAFQPLSSLQLRNPMDLFLIHRRFRQSGVSPFVEELRQACLPLFTTADWPDFVHLAKKIPMEYWRDEFLICLPSPRPMARLFRILIRGLGVSVEKVATLCTAKAKDGLPVLDPKA